MPLILKTPSDLRAFIGAQRADRKTVGFVPTMGALHEGHLTLARAALADCDTALVSIFVNPKQFAPHEDFDRYPRLLTQDAALLENVGEVAIFAPEVEVMYPPHFQTSVTVGNISKPLEGEFRPHFFTGVATVVARLLLLAGADRAYFGEKDFQQLQVVRRLVQDLAIPTEIVGVPVVREPSGLALSSRNAYLSEEERSVAPLLYATMRDMARRLTEGTALDQLEREAADALLQAGFTKVDYCTVRDIETLLPPQMRPEATSAGLRILAAAWLGKTRLIDNIAVDA